MNELCAVDGCGRARAERDWCHAHYERVRRGDPVGGPILDTPEKRFWAKVDTSGECWIWTGATGGGRRYGRFGKMQAHAWAYVNAGGVIPAGWDVDHLCRTTLCVRPDHLEAVTHRENIMRGVGIAAINARKTHCKRGHEFTAENTYWMRNGGRACRTCSRLYYHWKKAAA